jgi:hypothetical protein
VLPAVILIVNEGVDSRPVGRVRSGDPLVVVVRGRVGVPVRGEDDPAFVGQVVEIGPDESSVDEMGGDQLNAAVRATESPRWQVGDVEILTSVRRPVENDLRGTNGLHSQRARRRRCRLRLQSPKPSGRFAVESVAAVLAFQAPLAPLACSEADVVPGDSRRDAASGAVVRSDLRHASDARHSGAPRGDRGGGHHRGYAERWYEETSPQNFLPVTSEHHSPGRGGPSAPWP